MDSARGRNNKRFDGRGRNTRYTSNRRGNRRHEGNFGDHLDTNVETPQHSHPVHPYTPQNQSFNQGQFNYQHDGRPSFNTMGEKNRFDGRGRNARDTSNRRGNRGHEGNFSYHLDTNLETPQHSHPVHPYTPQNQSFNQGQFNYQHDGRFNTEGDQNRFNAPRGNFPNFDQNPIYRYPPPPRTSFNYESQEPPFFNQQSFNPNTGRGSQNRFNAPRGNFPNYQQNPMQRYPAPPRSNFINEPHEVFHFNPQTRQFPHNYNMHQNIPPPVSQFTNTINQRPSNLQRINSVGSLNSEKSLNLSVQDHGPKNIKRNRKKNRKKTNPSSSSTNVGLEMSDGDRPISRSSSYSNDLSNEGKNNVRTVNSSISGDNQNPTSRTFCVNDDTRREFTDLNLSSESNTKQKSKCRANYRAKGPRFGGEKRETPGNASCSSGQYNVNKTQELNTLFHDFDNENNQTAPVEAQDISRVDGKQKGCGNSKKDKKCGKNKDSSKPNLQKSSITIDQLEMLRQHAPMEILQILCEDKHEYSCLLQEDHETKIFVSVVDILRKICETPSSQQRAEILRQASLPNFTSQLFNCVTEYPFLEDDILKHVNQFFENTILLYETLSDFMPSANRMWHNHIVEVVKSLNVMTKNPKIELDNNLLNMAKNLLNEVAQYFKEEAKEVIPQACGNKKETYFPEPVGDFRTVSIYPRPEDVFAEQPFLYPNIIKGPYRSVEHYLDIHFKLLREDFMSPIRQAMRDYKKQCNTKDKFKRINNVRMYRKVKFLHPKTVFDTVGYEICFDVDNKINRVNWEFCSRFMYGSLLFFTNDDFDSFFMATVLVRNVKDLENKLVTVELVESLDNVKSILGKEFIMAESEAYFNPYFQVLKALQRFDETNFPLAKYLVHVSTETQPPHYLNFNELYTIKMPENSVTFRILSDLEWPLPEQLGLDISQYTAFNAALTNDLTVIQGPPGTGKTFLGLKIAKALLGNAHAWNHSNTPIFVVCFTNHALDQFLEGLLPVTNKLVRIGGKSKGSELDKFNIRERRKEYSYYKKVQNREIRDLKLQMSKAFADIQVYQSNLQAMENTHGVISFKTLQYVMNEGQRNYFSGDDDFLDWLLEGVAASKNKDKVKIIITADRGVVREAPAINEIISDTEDTRIKQAFFDMIDIDTSIGPSEDTVTVQFACDLDSVAKKREELMQQLNGRKRLHKTHFLQIKNTCESLDLLLSHLKKELLECRKFPRSELEKENLLEEMYLRKLIPDDRWRLYHTWMNILRDGLIVTLGQKNAQYKDFAFRYEQLRQNDDLQILKTANVVGTTTTLAAKFQPMFEALAPRIVIVEEAAEVLEAHIIASLSKSCQHLILIGDHKQLRPNVAEVRMARQYQLDVSMFERLVLNDLACHTLTLQHRMRPEISKQLVPTIYPELRDDISVLNREDIRGMDTNVFFMTHNNFEDEVTEITSKRNHFEAEILLGLAKYLVQQGYKPQEITILATYKGQMYHMKNEIRKITGFPKGVQITVVDNFQGEENKIILLSLVRSNAVKKIGFLEIENRICVALSRARDGLYIVGNMNCLTANCEIWAKIRNSLVKQKCYGPALNLRCQIHKDQKTKIETANDFSKVSEGGCSLLCGQPLPCGHSCKSMCHVEQDFHKLYKCKEPCSKILCMEGHPCPKKCHQQCGQCLIPMRRHLLCGHYANVPCHMEVSSHPCSELVQARVPSCQHIVTVPCHTRFNPECNLPCTKRLECGHSCELPCHETDDPDHLDYLCMKPCARLNKDCSQDHKCLMACFEECKPCPEVVIRELPCGHSLKIECSKDVSTVVCKQKCTRILGCGHPCDKKCFQICEPCSVPVTKKVVSCGHEILVPCSTRAVRQNCKGPCPNILECGHKCARRCMDTCSSKDCEHLVELKEETNLFPLLCGHSQAHVPCNKIGQVKLMTPNELLQYCTEPCGKELMCKHICGGSCSECMQGRIHKICNERCGNILICGHSCKVPCREVCPPCNEPCRHECKHSKCNRKCGEECVPCKEPCDYACPHLQCTESCGKLCNRDPCYEPCREQLSCAHSCVGYCGEPCPPCRKCEPEHFEEFFCTGEETEEDAKWVLLTDCGHTFESSGLELWLEIVQEGGEIGCKVCPRCKTPIVKVQRFMNHIKQTYLDIQEIKAKCFGKRDEIKKERAKALRKVQNVIFTPMTTENESLDEDELRKMFVELNEELREVKGKKRNTISSQRLCLLCFWTEFFISIYSRKQEVWPRLNEECRCKLNSNINSLTSLLMKRRQKISEEEKQGFEREVKRIHRLADLLVYVSSVEYRMAQSFSWAKEARMAAEKLIFSVSVYDNKLDEAVKIALANLKKQIKSSTELSPEEKAMINKAMSSSFNSTQKTGHWFKCKNGHKYCITECGGAMEEAVCPERGCGLPIGGRQHRVRDDQVFDTEMDGARHPAWSDANNMGNYFFN